MALTNPLDTLIMLGMHRSGTSMLARVCNFRGVELGEYLIPGASDNVMGFFEDAKIVDINERLLKLFGTSHLGITKLPKQFENDPQLNPFYAEAETVLQDHFMDKFLFGFKDPRLCRLLPFWQKILRPYPISVGYAIGVRHPLEVAQSLHRRNELPIAAGLKLWLIYMLEAERCTRGLRRSFVPYSEMIRDWRGSLKKMEQDLDFAFPISEKKAALEIEAFVRPELKHNHLPPHFDHPEIPDHLKETLEQVYAFYLGAHTLTPEQLDNYYKLLW